MNYANIIVSINRTIMIVTRNIFHDEKFEENFFLFKQKFLFWRKKIIKHAEFWINPTECVWKTFSKSQATSKLQRNIANVAFRKAASSSSLKAMTKLKGKWKRKKRKKGKIDSLFLKQDNSKLIRFRLFLIFHIFFILD